MAVIPVMSNLPAQLAVLANTSSSLVFSGLSLDDGDGNANTQGVLTLTLSAPGAAASSLSNTQSGTASSMISGRQTLVLSGTSSELQTFLARVQFVTPAQQQR
jgi:hypothetical protein